MAWLSRLFGIGRSRLFLEGDHEFGFEVVGESKYQDALSNICGGHCEEGHEHECVAELVPEPDNPYDPNAVAVLIEGEKVAYLSRFDAKRYLDELARLGHAGDRASCNAMINGGWDRGGRDKGYFGVELDVAWPLRTSAPVSETSSEMSEKSWRGSSSRQVAAETIFPARPRAQGRNIKLLLATGILIVVMFFAPQLLEATNSSCGAVERLVLRQVASSKNRGEGRADIGWAAVLLNFSDGAFVATKLQQEYPGWPTAVSCAMTYYAQLIGFRQREGSGSPGRAGRPNPVPPHSEATERFSPGDIRELLQEREPFRSSGNASDRKAPPAISTDPAQK